MHLLTLFKTADDDRIRYMECQHLTAADYPSFASLTPGGLAHRVLTEGFVNVLHVSHTVEQASFPHQEYHRILFNEIAAHYNVHRITVNETFRFAASTASFDAVLNDFNAGLYDMTSARTIVAGYKGVQRLTYAYDASCSEWSERVSFYSICGATTYEELLAYGQGRSKMKSIGVFNVQTYYILLHTKLSSCFSISVVDYGANGERVTQYSEDGEYAAFLVSHTFFDYEKHSSKIISIPTYIRYAHLFPRESQSEKLLTAPDTYQTGNTFLKEAIDAAFVAQQAQAGFDSLTSGIDTKVTVVDCIINKSFFLQPSITGVLKEVYTHERLFVGALRINIPGYIELTPSGELSGTVVEFHKKLCENLGTIINTKVALQFKIYDTVAALRAGLDAGDVDMSWGLDTSPDTWSTQHSCAFGAARLYAYAPEAGSMLKKAGRDPQKAILVVDDSSRSFSMKFIKMYHLTNPVKVLGSVNDAEDFCAGKSDDAVVLLTSIPSTSCVQQDEVAYLRFASHFRRDKGKACGDGVVDPNLGEECDGTNKCGLDCKCVSGYSVVAVSPNSTCVWSCGNGIFEPHLGEQCDGGKFCDPATCRCSKDAKPGSNGTCVKEDHLVVVLAVIISAIFLVLAIFAISILKANPLVSCCHFDAHSEAESAELGGVGVLTTSGTEEKQLCLLDSPKERQASKSCDEPSVGALTGKSAVVASTSVPFGQKEVCKHHHHGHRHRCGTEHGKKHDSLSQRNVVTTHGVLPIVRSDQYTEQVELKKCRKRKVGITFNKGSELVTLLSELYDDGVLGALAGDEAEEKLASFSEVDERRQQLCELLSDVKSRHAPCKSAADIVLTAHGVLRIEEDGRVLSKTVCPSEHEAGAFTVTNVSDHTVSVKLVYQSATPAYHLRVSPSCFRLAAHASHQVSTKFVLYYTTNVDVLVFCYAFRPQPPELSLRPVVRHFTGAPSRFLNPELFTPEVFIGHGGSGNVYRSEFGGCAVALKRLRSSRYARDIVQELSMLGSLCHPNVVRLYGLLYHPQFTIVMEYCPMGSLAELLRKGGELDECFKIRALLDITLGGSYLHLVSVFHRDLKPGNTLVVSANPFALQPCVKITDFGTSRTFSNMSAFSFEKRVGTPLYVAPEIIQGRDYNAQADIFSFAVTAWETLTQTVPYMGMSAPVLAQYVISGRRLPLSVEEARQLPMAYTPLTFPMLRKCFTPPIVEVITQAWQQDPLLRPTFQSLSAAFGSIFKRMRENRIFDMVADQVDSDLEWSDSESAPPSVTGTLTEADSVFNTEEFVGMVYRSYPHEHAPTPQPPE